MRATGWRMAAACWLVAAAAAADDPTPRQAYERVHSDLYEFEKLKPAPPAEVELGRRLFFDPRLSRNRAISCATCHMPSRAWSDGQRRARGAGHRLLERNTPSLLNATARTLPYPFFWDGRADTLEAAVLTALYNRQEMDRDPRDLIAVLGGMPDYVRRFAALYAGGITPDAFSRAVAAFIRQELRARDSAFTRFGRDPGALSASAQRGLSLFAGKAGCLQCHTGPYFSDDYFHNVGLKPTPGIDDPGRYAVVSGQFVRAFRTQPLRDAAATAPYMHDGSIGTLAEVVEFYDRGGDVAEHRSARVKPLGLSAKEKEDLVAFLRELISDPLPTRAPALPAERPASSLREGSELAGLWLGFLRAALERGDPASAAGAGAAARKALAQLSRLGASEPCLDAADRGLARLLEDGAGRRGSAGSAARLARDWAACAREIAVLEPEDLLGVDALLDKAEALTARVEASAPARRAEGKACLESAAPERIVAELRRGRFGREETTRLEDALRPELLRYFSFKAFLAGDVKRCEEFTVAGPYSGHTRRSGPWACREKMLEEAFYKALVTRPPDLVDICIESFRISTEVQQLSEADARSVCGLVSRASATGHQICRRLMDGYLHPDKLLSCVNQYRRMEDYADPAICDTQLGGPPSWMEQCRALAAFQKAHPAGDVELCGGHELCRAFMGDAAGSLALSRKRVTESYCALVAAPAAPPADAARASALFELADGALRDQSGASAALLSGRWRRLESLRRRQQQALSATGASSGASR